MMALGVCARVYAFTVHSRILRIRPQARSVSGLLHCPNSDGTHQQQQHQQRHAHAFHTESCKHPALCSPQPHTYTHTQARPHVRMFTNASFHKYTHTQMLSALKSRVPPARRQQHHDRHFVDVERCRCHPSSSGAVETEKFRIHYTESVKCTCVSLPAFRWAQLHGAQCFFPC